MTKFKFDATAAIAAAWDFLWKSNLEQRSIDAQWRAGETYYLTASDVECQVRQFAEETAASKPWGSTGRAYGRAWRSTVRMRGDLNHLVRDWLLGQVSKGRLASHNFGRGHISGMRFRPAGEPMSAAELATMASKERRKGRTPPRHFGRRGGYPLCTEKRRHSFSRPNHRIRCSSDWETVTCKACQNLKAEWAERQARKLKEVQS